MNSDFSYIDRYLKLSFYKDAGFISSYSVGMYVYIEFIHFFVSLAQARREFSAEMVIFILQDILHLHYIDAY